jgi:Rieske Fe-S protein
MSTTVTRRSALTALATLVAGSVAGFVYGRSNGAAKATSTQPGYTGQTAPHGGKLLAVLAALPVGGGSITSGVVITRQSGAVVHAFSSSCTHLGCTVSAVSQGKIFCPCHGSVFDAATGAVLQGPATRPLPTVPIKVSNGGVYTA